MTVSSWVLTILKNGNSAISLSKLFHYLTTFLGKKKILKSVCQVGFFHVQTCFQASSTVHLQEESGFFSTVLVRYLEIAIRSTLTLLFLRLNHVSQPLFIHHVFHCLCAESLLDLLPYVNHFRDWGDQDRVFQVKLCFVCDSVDKIYLFWIFPLSETT